MKFRPCIDLHEGKVKQIVGSTLNDDDSSDLETNFSTDRPSSWFADLYKKDDLTGGHIIKLGLGNDDAAIQALKAWPGGMQIGGGVTEKNAGYWLDQGASHVIVTSYVFRSGVVDKERLGKLVASIGKERLVLDLSCRKRDGEYYIVTDRWQLFTDVKITRKNLDWFACFCDEILIHAADVEGQCLGVEEDLIKKLSRWSGVPVTYAGGVRNLNDMDYIRKLTDGRLDVTIGSALDIFGGKGLTYQQAVDYHHKYRLASKKD